MEPHLLRNTQVQDVVFGRRRTSVLTVTGPSVSAGPKLFKEPSFKSNKFIIHNALSRCCLAGKVNETQKNRMVEVDESFYFT